MLPYADIVAAPCKLEIRMPYEEAAFLAFDNADLLGSATRFQGVARSCKEFADLITPSWMMVKCFYTSGNHGVTRGPLVEYRF